MRPPAERLTLSIFPGMDVLGMGFEREGFCVVRGPDVILGGDIRDFHPPAGVFDGVIGGDPCQAHSVLANLVRAKGLEPKFPDMTEEYARIVAEAEPRWFLRENVPQAPGLHVEGYGIHTFLLDNSWLDSGDGWGEQQMRKRRFWFGLRDRQPVKLDRWLSYCALELPAAQAVCADARGVPVKLGGSGKVKRTTVTHDACQAWDGGKTRRSAVAGRYTLAEMLELQGLPPGLLGVLAADGEREAEADRKRCPARDGSGAGSGGEEGDMTEVEWCRQMLRRIREDLERAPTEEGREYEREKLREYRKRLWGLEGR